MISLVSVIIPVYNGDKYIGSAIDSVLKQDYPNIEIIIIDDGSTDNTESIVKAYGNKIKYFYKENGGEASARNHGLKVAKGEFIAFLDCDDLYRKDKISKQVKTLLENPKCGFIYNDVDVINDYNDFLYTLKSEDEFVNREDMLAYVLYRQIIPATASIMIRQNCLDNSIYYTEKYSNSVDYFFSIRLLMKTKGKYLKESLYLYRRHEGNLTNNHNKQKECERNIVKELGINTINDIVEASTFDNDYKVLLLSKIYFKIDEINLAYKILENIDMKKYSFEYFFHKGVCEYDLNMYDNAIKSFMKAIDLEPARAETYNNLGCCYIRIGVKEKARESFEHATKLNKDYLDARINLFNITQDVMDFRFTERILRKVLTKY
ncbi:Glycosyltransferase involved in cell wall bisynthesis [Proteiniborus ethanoligenes]|uniref:Glycosyltransferase involved in cell wall bisynthesis n=1 Tax=Proteiniborus ethanoligenes TaxID=415015 RepID=A0A1H3QWZ4_9FIRM|nr:glycosyltransferase [Proteiniborus ethanoligenes]SDZ17601.1 Glycosyltransferase involved in cell wall bisynthesis [Proteiniborus ethanoligenes]